MDHQDSGNEYRYSPLLEPDSFRIIILHPSASISSPIACTLAHSSLLHYDNSIIDHYTTLSYVWGNASDRRRITVNGKSLYITASLDTALRHIRDREHDMKIWADGICINQSSVDDKNNQVRLMGVIYGLARHTIIFLGEPTPETDKIFDILASHRPVFYEKMKSGFLSNVLRDAGIQSQGGQSMDLQFMNLVENHVLNRTWFSRVWILQELVLSGDPWLQIGTQRVRWGTFSDLILGFWKPLELGHHNVASMIAMHTLRSEFVSLKNVARQISPCDFLLQILHSRRGSGVFDPRDMLYAHLGMHQSGTETQDVEELIGVDYQKSVPEVYTDLALYLLRNQRGLGFLSHVEDKALEDRNPDLPSWVPDWTSPHASPDAQFHFTDHFKMASVDMVHIVLGTPRVLGCVGDVIGQIEFIIEDMPSATQVELLSEMINDNDDYKVHYSDEENERIKDEPADDDDENEIPRGLNLQFLFQALYEHLRTWVGEQHLPDIEDIFWREEDTLEDMFWQLKRRMEVYPKFDPASRKQQEPYTKWWTDRDGRYKSGKGLIRQLMLAFTKDDVRAFLAGKKLAFLDSRDPGAITLVPASSQIGDFVCRFNDSHSVPYVLRNLEASTIPPDLDEALIEFFDKRKNDVREKFVQYTEEGEIIWKMDDLEDHKKVILGATIELWSEYKNESMALHAEGRRQREAAVGNAGHLSPELKAQLKQLSDNVMRAMEIASEEEEVRLWSSYIDEKAAILKDHDCAYLLTPELKRKLDELSSKVIRATNLVSEEEVLLQQIDTSEVNHVYLIGECLVDDINPEFSSRDEEQHQIRDFKDKEPQYIIALH